MERHIPVNLLMLLETWFTMILKTASSIYVPRVKKGFFFKFWWNEEVNLLKEASVESHKLWKSAGKPRDGPIFANRQSCRFKYRKCLRDNRKFETEQYTKSQIPLV